MGTTFIFGVDLFFFDSAFERCDWKVDPPPPTKKGGFASLESYLLRLASVPPTNNGLFTPLNAVSCTASHDSSRRFVLPFPSAPMNTHPPWRLTSPSLFSLFLALLYSLFFFKLLRKRYQEMLLNYTYSKTNTPAHVFFVHELRWPSVMMQCKKKKTLMSLRAQRLVNR